MAWPSELSKQWEDNLQSRQVISLTELPRPYVYNLMLPSATGLGIRPNVLSDYSLDWYLLLCIAVDPPAPVECPIAGIYNFTQIGVQEFKYETKIRGVTERPRVAYSCDLTESEFKVCFMVFSHHGSCADECLLLPREECIVLYVLSTTSWLRCSYIYRPIFDNSFKQCRFYRSSTKRRSGIQEIYLPGSVTLNGTLKIDISIKAVCR